MRPHHKIPIAAAGAMMLVISFELLFVWQYRHRLWDANYILLEKKREALTSSRPPDDVAILGTSRFYHIQPQPISEALGNARVTNYAWGYCGAEAYEAILRGLINAGRKPKIVLVDSVPELYGYQPDLLSVTRAPGLRIGLAITAPKWAAIQTMLDHSEWKTAWQICAQYLTPPSTLYREKLSGAIKSLLNTGKLPPLPPGYDRLVTTWENQGWFYFTAPEEQEHPSQSQMLAAATGPYILRSDSKKIAHKYERFLRFAQEHDVEVIMIPVPNNHIVYTEFTNNGIYDRYDKWLSKLTRKYKNFHAPQPRWMEWPGLLGDGLHVNGAGAQKHMDLITEILETYQESKPTPQ